MELTLTNTTFTLTLEGHEQLWAAHLGKTIHVPIPHMIKVSTDTPDDLWNGIRAPGTFVPGLIRAGTYYTTKGREFWYVTRQSGPLIQTPVLMLELTQIEYYKRIVLSAQQPEIWSDRLTTAIAASDSNLNS